MNNAFRNNDGRLKTEKKKKISYEPGGVGSRILRSILHLPNSRRQVILGELDPEDPDFDDPEPAELVSDDFVPDDPDPDLPACEDPEPDEFDPVDPEVDPTDPEVNDPVRGFLVERGTPGFSASVIEGKYFAFVIPK